MTLDPHMAERLILIGCHDALARKHALRLFLKDETRPVWIDEVREFLNTTVKYDSTSCAVFVEPKYQGPGNEDVEEIVALVSEHYKQARINQNTVEVIGSAQGRNLVRNVRLASLRPEAFRSALDALANMKGRTVVIVGAGPSAVYSMKDLQRHRGPIIAVNTSAGACEWAGVKPHVVLCMESKLVREGVNLMDKRQSRLAMDMTGHPGNWLTEEEAQGNEQLTFIGSETNLAPYAHQLGLLPLAYGGSCTTAAVSLALTAGAKRVALVGQDCAFQVTDVEDGKFHALMYAAGTPYTATRVTIDGARMRAIIDKPTVPLHEVDVISVPDVEGIGQVFTTHSMLSFAHWFRDQPEDVHARIVNCTEDGAMIEGLAQDTLHHVIESGREFDEDSYSVRSRGAFGLGEVNFSTRAARTLKHLTNVAQHGLGIRNGDAFLIDWARRHTILNMWVGPERLRMRRMPELLPADIGHRIAETIRTACREIVACANGEL